MVRRGRDEITDQSNVVSFSLFFSLLQCITNAFMYHHLRPEAPVKDLKSEITYFGSLSLPKQKLQLFYCCYLDTKIMISSCIQ